MSTAWFDRVAKQFVRYKTWIVAHPLYDWLTTRQLDPMNAWNDAIKKNSTTHDVGVRENIIWPFIFSYPGQGSSETLYTVFDPFSLFHDRLTRSPPRARSSATIRAYIAPKTNMMHSNSQSCLAL